MLFFIQGFSKQSENLHHRKVTIGCLSLCAGIYGMNKTGHHGGGWGDCSLAIFAVLILCGPCQCVFISLFTASVVLFFIQGNFWLSKSAFSPAWSQRTETMLIWDRSRSFGSATFAFLQWSWNYLMNSSSIVRKKTWGLDSCTHGKHRCDINSCSLLRATPGCWLEYFKILLPQNG